MKLPSFFLLLALAVPAAAQKIKVKTKPGAVPVAVPVPSSTVVAGPAEAMRPAPEVTQTMAEKYAAQITAERLRTHLAVLASDEKAAKPARKGSIWPPTTWLPSSKPPASPAP